MQTSLESLSHRVLPPPAATDRLIDDQLAESGQGHDVADRSVVDLLDRVVDHRVSTP
jgi:hypothetical protein